MQRLRSTGDPQWEFDMLPSLLWFGLVASQQPPSAPRLPGATGEAVIHFGAA